ncbi:hypothetical protein [Bacillus suaedaesalsae]|uniref:Uncharacterized protein n=1 Tax=Bacillus suaedaesalsae TaxID=2810349 RepID=A0ABS2DDZ9_9BACI|nr:hypothetical protein [Bacillus suaedaesalsae]MBM6616679.1 hypothetical protein [Bacillus suaedaesalsae]
MIGLMIAIIIFNLLCFKTNNRLTPNQIISIWLFTIAFQTSFDIIVEFKYYSYWYFEKESVDWAGLLPHLLLVPPVNIIFLNWFPFEAKLVKKILYLVFFIIAILMYELLTLLPEPWGYFNYGWWSIWHSVVVNPILLLLLLGFYKWICKLEKAS